MSIVTRGFGLGGSTIHHLPTWGFGIDPVGELVAIVSLRTGLNETFIPPPEPSLQAGITTEPGEEPALSASPGLRPSLRHKTLPRPSLDARAASGGSLEADFTVIPEEADPELDASVHSRAQLEAGTRAQPSLDGDLREESSLDGEPGAEASLDGDPELN